jgi:hypothetical protein
VHPEHCGRLDIAELRYAVSLVLPPDVGVAQGLAILGHARVRLRTSGPQGRCLHPPGLPWKEIIRRKETFDPQGRCLHPPGLPWKEIIR